MFDMFILLKVDKLGKGAFTTREFSSVCKGAFLLKVQDAVRRTT